MPKFTGGPYDGLRPEFAEVERVGRLAVYDTSGGQRVFLFLPTVEHLGRLARGEAKVWCGDHVLAYEAIPSESDQVEFVFDDVVTEEIPGPRLRETWASALDPCVRAVTEEELRWKADLRRLAARLVGELSEATLGPSTVVTLLMSYTDPEGNRYGPERVELDERLHVEVPGHPERVAEVAAAAYRELLSGIITNRIANRPAGYMVSYHGPRVPLRLVDARLLVIQPDDAVGVK